MPKLRAVNPGTLGAWLFKCSPDTWDLAGFLADGEREIHNWSVRESYRLDLFEPGQRAYFWASEGHEGIEPGILGEGVVTGRFHDGTGNEYWVAEDEADEVRSFAEMKLRLLGTCLPRSAFVVDPVLSQAEIVRQPFFSNPSFLTIEQHGALEGLLGR